tara:strand:+ start:1312 stop:1851 length:540 start_codon:yes stop_codon:yes gene_type:complete
MRIISGKNRGKKISIPKNLPVRPTTDQSKEAVFNIINNNYYFDDDLKVLDLFSGSGNISYEFASRGVKNIRCIDNNSNCIRFINRISNELNFNLKVTKSSSKKYLMNCLEQYDIIFLDPPYEFEIEEYFEIINLIFERNILNADGIIIAEHSKQLSLKEHKKFNKYKNYGGCSFSFFNK